ncbi:MAG: M28 family peptidase, partial [Thermoguttaceae bacterium]
VLVGELPFIWQTDFEFSWSGGWKSNQYGETYERDLVIVIPGKNRRRAVIMADHYDTAYMEDVYGYPGKGGGPRIAAAGADDNHSATAAMMLAAPIFLDLSKQGKLESDIWLVHLTGEEFPSDCMGARALCQQVVEGSLRIRLTNGRWKSLARTRVGGVYVMDMIAHNNDHEKDVFQIAPGTNHQSMLLAEEAHAAAELWNASTPVWNRRAERRGAARGKRSADGITIPDVALHLPLSGEVRPAYYRRSALYNTDGQIFSDAGVPVVLFMENYDINRQGYHDTHDTMENIDLDYGAALSAIAIESVARAAGRTPASLPGR